MSGYDCEGGEVNREFDQRGRERSARDTGSLGIAGCVFWSAVFFFLFGAVGAIAVYWFVEYVSMGLGK